ncbi:MAG TPA: hypothetical protein VMT87_07515 [Vicinamibacteria bacterium]|nr:hypothetical protein [Vicinamibacteria bacterium]
MDTQRPAAEPEAERWHPPPFLRLVWSNPDAGRVPRTRVDFAAAIERQLAGRDGLTREQFLAVYSGRRARLALAPS